jgi:carboxyl-terminal processing protease
MKIIFWRRKSAFLLMLTVFIAFGACKKSKVTPEPDPAADSNAKQTPTTNRTELTNDSLFLYAKQIYYWNTALPSYDDFMPRQYSTASTELANYENNLFNLVKASASADYIAGDPDPKYSYIEDIDTRNPSASAIIPNTRLSVDLEGNGNDTGVMWIPFGSNSNYIIFVTVVYPGSDAEAQGVKRGWAITKINGKSFGTNYNSEYTSIYDEFAKDKVTIEGYKIVNDLPGETFNLTLTKKSYSSNPVYLSKVISSGNLKIGYLAYGRFSTEDNSNQVLENAFGTFVAQGVTDLVIDLRYNGGGYISTAEHLVNLIAPGTATGVMYKEYFNPTLRDQKATIMKNQPLLDKNDKVQFVNGRMMNYFDDVSYTVAKNTFSFEKFGNLKNVKNIVFLVSRNTASASELVINSLKPVMNVKLVGETTYGKPIGFFPIRLQNKYDVFFSLFETKNSADQGGYFTGMVPDAAVDENPTYQLGDEKEPYLARAISLLNPAAVPASGTGKSKAVMSINGKTISLKAQHLPMAVGQGTSFVGMIENRHNGKR